MYILVGIIVVILVLGLLYFLYLNFKTKISFFLTGIDAGFSFADLHLLWNVATICELEEPTNLFWSIPSLTKCMTQITTQSQAEGTDKSPKVQALITKLFDYRTKIQNESDNKKGMDSTHSLSNGQKLRIILPGKGVFVSEILNNGHEIVVPVPRQKNLIPIPAEQWVGKVVNVYLWRKGDARYVFDSTVMKNGLFLGQSCIFLKHSVNLVRTQKRKSVRAQCKINAQLYMKSSEKDDLYSVETKNGYRCIVEDISESGALIRIGGKAVQNIHIKIQFNIKQMLIVMAGIVRTVEYNEELKQSLLHFECTHIDSVMRNEVLSYVYNMLPEGEKEVIEALSMTDTDEQEDFSESGNKTASENSSASENPSVSNSNTSAVNEGYSSEDLSKQDTENQSENSSEKKLYDETVTDEDLNVF